MMGTKYEGRGHKGKNTRMSFHVATTSHVHYFTIWEPGTNRTGRGAWMHTEPRPVGSFDERLFQNGEPLLDFLCRLACA